MLGNKFKIRIHEMSKRIIALIMLLALFGGVTQPAYLWADIIGYSVRANEDNHLYRINMNTGAAADLGYVDFLDCEGMAFVGSHLLVVGGEIEELWNITTPPGTKIGNTGNRNGLDAGMDYDYTRGKLFNLQGDSTRSYLYQLNPLTGAATFVGQSATNFRGNALAINNAGKAFAADFLFNKKLYSVNLDTGGMTLVGSLSVCTPNIRSGLSFDQSGTLWALTDEGKIYTINTTTGKATYQRRVTLNGSPIDQFEAFAIPVPEPSTFVMLAGLGVIFICGTLRFVLRFPKNGMATQALPRKNGHGARII
jgi:hypothetical protein